MTCARACLLGLWLLVGLSACATRPPAPESTLPPAAMPPSSTILTTIAQRWQDIEGLRALIRVTLTSPQGRYSTRQSLLWHRPASLRLETFSLFGQPLMSLVAEQEGISIYYPQQGTFLQGPASAAILARVIGIPLDLAEVAPLLVGSLPASLTNRTAALYQQIDAGQYLLRFLDGQGQLRQDLWVDTDQLLPQRTIRYASAAVPTVDIAYSDFRRTDDVPFPFEVRLWVPGAESEIRLQFLSIELNPGLPAEIFQLLPPAGVQVVPLD